MKKKIPAKHAQPAKVTPAIRPGTDLKLPYILLVIAYILIPVVTPNFYSLDSAGPKFFALSLLNIIAFLVFWMKQEFR